MTIIISKGGGSTFAKHPSGQYGARCIDVVDLGWMPGSAKYPDPKYKIRVVFYCGETVTKDGNDYPALVSTTMTATLAPKGRLLPFLESWRGQVFTKDELDSFDVERMVGAAAFVQIVHNDEWANIQTIAKLPKGMEAPDAPTDYVRACKRPDWAGPAPHPDMSDEDHTPADTTDYSEPDSELPF